ncbi:MAG TPA: 50S ribosomal protein L25 [Bacillota bacterium]|nr:50S ribosomal protein L25 [Bacillota bacterium]
MMYTLNSKKRSMDLKPNQMRRKGLIPGVLFGKSLESSLSIQFTEQDLARFLRTNTEGSQAELTIDDEKYIALLREVTYIPATNKLEHLSFQVLLADEVIETVARIVFLNRDTLTGLVQQEMSEVSYRALPRHLTDRIEVDLEGLEIGDTIRVDDLDIAKDPNIELVDPLDTVVAAIIDSTSYYEDELEAEEADSEGQEPELVGESPEAEDEESEA